MLCLVSLGWVLFLVALWFESMHSVAWKMTWEPEECCIARLLVVQIVLFEVSTQVRSKGFIMHVCEDLCMWMYFSSFSVYKVPMPGKANSDQCCNVLFVCFGGFSHSLFSEHKPHSCSLSLGTNGLPIFGALFGFSLSVAEFDLPWVLICCNVVCLLPIMHYRNHFCDQLFSLWWSGLTFLPVPHNSNPFICSVSVQFVPPAELLLALTVLTASKNRAKNISTSAHGLAIKREIREAYWPNWPNCLLYWLWCWSGVSVSGVISHESIQLVLPSVGKKGTYQTSASNGFCCWTSIKIRCKIGFILC